MVEFFNPYSIGDITDSINATITKSGLWFPISQKPKKTLLNAANDYSQLFLNIKRHNCG
jgi:hypothetical protein